MNTTATATRAATIANQTYTVKELTYTDDDGNDAYGTYLVSKRGVWYMLQESYKNPGKFYMTSSGSGIKKDKFGNTIWVYMIGDIIEQA